MIGSLVEQMVNAGFNVSVFPREDIVTFRIGKVIDKEVCAIDWAITRLDLAYVPMSALSDECERRLQTVQQAVEQKTATPCKGGQLQ